MSVLLDSLLKQRNGTPWEISAWRLCNVHRESKEHKESVNFHICVFSINRWGITWDSGTENQYLRAIHQESRANIFLAYEAYSHLS